MVIHRPRQQGVRDALRLHKEGVKNLRGMCCLSLGNFSRRGQQRGEPQKAPHTRPVTGVTVNSHPAQKAERPAPSGGHPHPTCPSLQVSKAVESGGVGKKDEKMHLAPFLLKASCL